MFGYRGTPTPFDEDRLDRLEDRPTTKARRWSGISVFGQSLLMAFAETRDINLIGEGAAAAGAGFTVDRPADRPLHLPADQIWRHPKALGGMMLGLSRPSMAWSWSGRPERVEAVV